MVDSSSASEGRDDEGAPVDADASREADSGSTRRVDADSTAETTVADTSDDDLDELRKQVEEKYDFDDFRPADMAEMTAEEWDVAFDPDSWIVGEELLDRVERDLKHRIVTREVFAVLEHVTEDGEDRLLAYSDEGYALIAPDGSVEGEGTVLRDVKPTVALCSMEEYDVPDAPDDVSLPAPEDVAQGTGEFGNLMLQIVAAIQLLAGVGLVVVWLFTDLVPTSYVVAPAVALGFLLVGFFLFLVVANARLSDRFRAEEYRNRLRAIGLEEGTRPEFVPFGDGDDERPPNTEGADAETDRA